MSFRVEYFHATDRTERLLQRFDLHRGAAIARIDHFNICVDDPAGAYDHHIALGFGCSETIEDEQRLYAAWMYASRACTTSPSPAATGTGDGRSCHGSLR